MNESGGPGAGDLGTRAGNDRSHLARATVFIIDDDRSVRTSLAWLVESVDLAAESFESAAAFLEVFDPGRPGCIICDVRMPGMSGLDLQEKLRASGSQMPMIIITGYGDVPSAVRAMKAGAVDYLEKPVTDQVLLDHVVRAIERDALARRERAKHAGIEERLGRLTRREHEVMSLVIEGNSNKEIAVILGVSVKTVEAHRTQVMRKTQARSGPHLVRMLLSVNESKNLPAGLHESLQRTADRTAGGHRGPNGHGGALSR